MGNLSEFSKTPTAIIVHDPVRAGAFKPMEGIRNTENIESEFLFREFPDKQRYAEQHSALVAALRQHVSRVIYLDELIPDNNFPGRIQTNPNHVFTRDSILTFPWIPHGYIKSRMKPVIRRPESDVMELALQSLGLREILEIPEGLFVEGGDVIPFSRDGNRTLLIGYGPRTRYESIEHLADVLIPVHADEIIGIELSDWRMNLDGGFVPVAEDVVIADRESTVGARYLNRNEQHRIDLWEWVYDSGLRVIDTNREESVFLQSCNCVCLGNRKVVCYDLCDRVDALLRQHDIETFRIPGSELVKGRGGPRCMTRPIYG